MEKLAYYGICRNGSVDVVIDDQNFNYCSLAECKKDYPDYEFINTCPFYLDRQFQGSYSKDYFSCEEGAFEGMYFATEEEAKAYAEEHSYLLRENEILEVMLLEAEEVEEI